MSLISKLYTFFLQKMTARTFEAVSLAIKDRRILEAARIVIKNKQNMPFYLFVRLLGDIVAKSEIKDVEMLFSLVTGGKPGDRVAIWGDSHVETLFADEESLSVMGNVDIFRLSAASIAGLTKEISSLNTRYKIFHYKEKYSPKVIFFKFGQVDVEFGFYYLNILKEPVLFEDFVSNTLAKYRLFLSNFGKNIVVCGINLPSIQNIKNAINYAAIVIGNNYADIPQDEILKRISEFYQGIETRTQMSLFFNQQLAILADDLGLKYIDHTDLFIDTSTGLLQNKFFVDNDCHYHEEESKKNRHLCIGKLYSVIK